MEGQTPYVIGTLQNITERKRAEEELRKSEGNFRLSLDSSPLGVRISTIEAETLYANRAILDIYSYDSIEEMNKTPVKERYTPQSYAEYEIRKEKRTRGEFVPSEYEISIVRKNGEIRNLQVFRKEVIWNGTKQSQVIYKDITEHKRAEEKLNETLESLRESIKTTIQVLGAASEVRDPYTAGHQKRVADLARAIATEMKLPHDKIEGIRMAGSIHDIGKLSIPTEILSKPTKLTEIEFSLIKEHSQSGYEILKDVESPWPLAQIVYQHHERMNGSGYPRNLKGDEIILEARIMAVADVVEAMASYRLYRPTLGIEEALEEIEKNKGFLYDDTVADACLRLFREKGYQLK
jgi:PAS domain S-box-containing protein